MTPPRRGAAPIGTPARPSGPWGARGREHRPSSPPRGSAPTSQPPGSEPQQAPAGSTVRQTSGRGSAPVGSARPAAAARKSAQGGSGLARARLRWAPGRRGGQLGTRSPGWRSLWRQGGPGPAVRGVGSRGGVGRGTAAGLGRPSAGRISVGRQGWSRVSRRQAVTQLRRRWPVPGGESASPITGCGVTGFGGALAADDGGTSPPSSLSLWVVVGGKWTSFALPGRGCSLHTLRGNRDPMAERRKLRVLKQKQTNPKTVTGAGRQGLRPRRMRGEGVLC